MRRRRFLGGALGGAFGLASAPAWAALRTDFLTAANTPQNATFLLGLSAEGQLSFALPLPSRGHAAAAHPQRAEAVAFARRPGRFALVIACPEGTQIARLDAPEGRHFYGHGAYSADGQVLLTTENEIDSGAGRIGVWDVAAGYRRIDELPSGGIGPHEIIRLPSGGFAVANGGILTHPDHGRTKLNLPTMQTSLAWLHADGRLDRLSEAPPEMRQNSIRHIAPDAQGHICAALQWQGPPTQAVPLMARITPEGLTYHNHPQTARLRHYAGSVARSASGQVVLTGPKGDSVLRYDSEGRAGGSLALPRASGAAPFGADGLVISCAKGLAHLTPEGLRIAPVEGDWVFDNHLVAV